MWQDEYISKRDNMYVCWDNEGEFIIECSTEEQARDVISNFKDGIQRKYDARVIQQPISIIK